ncbi:MAG: DUF3078 domain-containing protein [Paludibacteraceae bacterium]|nr:DUF3078 domain-containing protein [Bacteroidales bacterium]MDY4850948.1 DUF3078 domain-containing protein [Paludibacteraceae bacterium]
MKFKVLLLSSLLTLGTVSAVADEPKVDDSKPTTGETLEQADAITEQATQPVKEKYWKCTGILSLNASATGLWNWAAGGNNNITTVAAANITLLYQKNSVAWETNLDTDFGMTYLESEFEPWRKSNDKINFTTKFGWEFHKTWYLTVLGSFKSQYARGYKYGADDNGDFKKPIAGWLSPSYTDISVGIDWKPNEIFSIYLAPVTGRISSCTLDSLSYVDGAGVEQMTSLRAAYGIDPDKTCLPELGFSAKAGVNYTRIENLKIISTVGIFTPYRWSEDMSDHRRFGNFDVDWDFAISYQFLKVLNVTLSTSLKYVNGVMIADKDGNNPVERVQFKGNLGLGIGYSF